MNKINVSGETRLEHDLLGDKKVPTEYYFGIQTLRAVENFDISRVKLGMFPNFVKGLAIVKEAAAMANRDLGMLDPKVADAIIYACQQVKSGKYDDHFVVDMIQGGAGTSTNMNANEVIANLALEKMGHKRGEYKYCHPNNHINLSQSTNDAYPTAVRISMLLSTTKVVDTLKLLIKSFDDKAVEFNDVIKMGRTQMQDAVPMTLGQEFHAFASTLKEEVGRFEQNSKLLLEVNMGATAIGTGINSDPDYTPICVKHLRDITGMPFVASTDMVEATSDTGVFIM
ncbi:MAG: lyase family protein, partial [Rikenellaceae bacterium]